MRRNNLAPVQIEYLESDIGVRVIRGEAREEIREAEEQGFHE